MQINDSVSWTETYTTYANVIAKRSRWGTLIALEYKPGGDAGFPMQGRYGQIMPIEGGGSVFVHEADIHSCVRGRA